MDSDETHIKIRPSVADDLDAIEQLIQPFVATRKLLSRTRRELEGLIVTGFTATDGGRPMGFASIEIYSLKLAEILCLAVADGYQGQGVGKRLIHSCVELARQRDVLEVMAISSAEGFLRECGFDYILPDEKKALFCQLRARHEEGMTKSE